MSGVPLETCWPLKKLWNNKFYYKAASCWYFYWVIYDWRSIAYKEQKNILHEIRKRKVNWIGHILRRNCLLQRVIEGKIQGGIELTGRQERRRRKLLDDLKERRGYSHLEEEGLDRAMWTARFGRGFGPVARQTTKWMNESTMHGSMSIKFVAVL